MSPYSKCAELTSEKAYTLFTRHNYTKPLFFFLLSGIHLTKHSFSYTVLKHISKQKLNKMYLMFSQVNTIDPVAEIELRSEPIEQKIILS